VSAPARLHPADVDAIAERVAELVVERIGDAAAPAGSADLVDAAEIARRFGLCAATVRARADAFGAIRVGDGPRPRLRFDPERVAAALASGSTDRRSSEPEVPAQPTVRRRRRPARAGTGPELLPIRGVRAP
jgi:hypothetical protein